MVLTQIYTIDELLSSPALKYNQTALAKLLNCNRGTLRKYMLDVDGKEHVVRMNGARYQLMTIPSSAKDK